MKTKYALKLGTIRYVVRHCDFAKAKLLATAEGCKDGESPFDYIDIINNEAWIATGFDVLSEAVHFAKCVAESDIFRAPSVEERELQSDDDHYTQSREWVTIREGRLDEGLFAWDDESEAA